MLGPTLKARPKEIPKPISVLLAEDHTVVREGLMSLLQTEKDIEVVGQAGTGRQAMQLAKDLKPDVVLMDIAMPQLNGIEATRQMRALAPDSKILVLSAHSDNAYVEQMLAFGASGYLIKQTSFELLAKAIREVHKGNTFFSPVITNHFRNPEWMSKGKSNKLKAKLETLSSREVEVLQLIAEGMANKQTAATLSISIKTVEKHRQHLMEKLGIHDTAGLTRYAISAGIIESSVQITIV